MIVEARYQDDGFECELVGLDVWRRRLWRLEM